ncbi:hypothetical protein DAPPUDRAFT_253601 [Daphnia pulex]|uniref:Uncharacterized protein n=1 Tax=Daphnia pulex TaxID=6669 RepID=E9H563_DAPPU|nr:hypothetical protein DAPPUDRAFT_253601 [Daphnia pulex]|eukprot:EFX73132.1 hypothetical protein DAPPUDRAFT_253601 [Daphnia pulex]
MAEANMERDGVRKGLHNRGPMFNVQHRAALVHECVTIAETPGQGPKRILEQSRRNHPEAIIALNPVLERRIQRAKRSAQPPTPNSVEEIVQSLETHPRKCKRRPIFSLELRNQMKTTEYLAFH